MFQNSSHSPSVSSLLIRYLKKPQAFPFLLSVFLLLTWLSLRLQHSSHFSAASFDNKLSKEDDSKANLVRFSSGFPSTLAKTTGVGRSTPSLLPFIPAFRFDRGIFTGGAVTCTSVHLGEIRPGAVRGNHRHYTCNETFVIWGAKTKFRLENSQVVGKGFAEAMISADEVVVAASPSGTAHALVNMDPIRSAFFVGCQDSVVNYSSSSTDFNVWKDL